jgi:exonuclease SbcD
MRILHTSDWHLGRQFHGVALEEDHDHALVQILSIIDDQQPDVLIVAGDIFDRANPPQSALKRLSEFLTTVRATSSAAIVLIAGNHDSAAQIGALGVLATDGEAIVRGPLDENEKPLIISDADGPVAISALPFAFEYAARLCLRRRGKLPVPQMSFGLSSPVPASTLPTECAGSSLPMHS